MTQSCKVVLKNYQDKSEIDYDIYLEDNVLANDWYKALSEDIIKPNLHLEKNFCFHGFPNTQRNLKYLCKQLNKAVYIINTSNLNYKIEDWFTPESVQWGPEYPINPGRRSSVGFVSQNVGLELKHEIMNRIHNHFEILQGTVEQLSEYYKKASPIVRYAIRQLNNLCHEIETLVLSKRHHDLGSYWVRPSQITTFLKAPRHNLTDEHRKGFISNSYDRVLGGVYMHWCQIGKTLFEVWRDEFHALPEDNPEDLKIDQALCDAITHLQYYSGEFDIEWGNDVTYDLYEWHRWHIDKFNRWLVINNYNPKDPKLSLGHLKIGQVDIKKAFGTTEGSDVWEQMGNYLDIVRIECGTNVAKYDYHWSDIDHVQRQMEAVK